MTGHADILYGNAFYRTMESKSTPMPEWRPIHVQVDKRLRRFYGLTMAQANSAVVAFRIQIMDEQNDGHNANEIAHVLYRLLRYRGDV